VVSTLFIFIFGFIYNKIAFVLTDWENHRTLDESVTILVLGAPSCVVAAAVFFSNLDLKLEQPKGAGVVCPWWLAKVKMFDGHVCGTAVPCVPRPLVACPCLPMLAHACPCLPMLAHA
jgi:hypothetical protein